MSRSARILLGAALLAYGVHLLAVFLTDRFLFADGSWFLLRLLCEERPAAWCTDCARQFFRSRFFCHLVQEGPALLASRFTTRFSVLSATYGATLLAFIPMSLLASWRYAADRRLLLFPLLSLFAGTMNADVYSVHPVHLLMALIWAVLFLLAAPRELSRGERALLALVSLLLLLCYETMLVFGPLLLLAAWLRLRGRFGEARPLGFLRLVASAYALAAILGALAIAFPWDPRNRNDFFEATLSLLLNPAVHPGVLASLVVVAALAALLAAPRMGARTSAALTVAVVAASLYLAALPLLWPAGTTFNPQMRARSLHVFTGLVAASGYLWARLGKLDLDRRRASLAFTWVALLGLGQCAWHVQASAQWAHFLGLLRTELARREGPIPFQVSIASRPSVGGWPVNGLHAKWPLTPLSLTLARGGPVRALIVFRDGNFSPIDPDRPDPRLERFGFDFRPYLDALEESRRYELGDRIDFTSGGQAWRYQWGGWHGPEAWGSWAGGPEFGLDLDVREPPAGEATLSAVVSGFVSNARPELVANVLVNGTAACTWTFRSDEDDARPKARRCRVLATALRPGRNRVAFVAAPVSPRALGLGEEERLLSLGFVRLRLVSANGPPSP